MARKREFDEAVVISKVQNLFWIKGYEATSYADLIQATNLGKGSLYAAYGNKHKLYLRTLEAYISTEVNGACDILRNTSLNPNERLTLFLNLPIDPVIKDDDRRGCFLCNAAVDFAPHDQSTQSLVTHGMDLMRNAIADTLSELSIKDHIDTADHVLAIYTGMRVLAKSGMTATRLEYIRNTEITRYE